MEPEYMSLVPARLSSVVEVRRALHPLQAQADRVGRQVEEFAETLDQLSSQRKTQFTDCTRVLPLVQGYERIASETVKRLKRRHSDEKRQFLRESRRRKIAVQSHATALALYDEEHLTGSEEAALNTTVRDLLHWEQERQTWELLGLMLQVRYPSKSDDDSTEETPLQRPRDLPIHRYSSEHSVYDKYLAIDDQAWEKHVILEWLTRSAVESREDVEDIVVDSSPDSATSGNAATGWLYSKEVVKGEKRLRSWPYTIPPEQLEHGRSVTSLAKQATVTHMDPDAVTRQNRQLKTEDLAFERATWIGCWELLRRGKSWEEIQDWCQRRHEEWRAISMRGDPRLGRSTGPVAGTLPGRAHWQRVCVQLARNGGLDDYERAVYGLLGGDEQSIFQVCRSWDDHLHALLSCQLSQNFGFYFCEQFGLEPALTPPDVSSRSRQSLLNFMDALFKQKQDSKEAITSAEMLQASIIKNRVAPYLLAQGASVADQLRSGQYASITMKGYQEPAATSSQPARAVTIDEHDSIRMLVHVLLIYQHLEAGLVDNIAMENLIVAYVDFLGRAGKQQLLPLYASYLSEDRAATCLARQLPFIKDTAERQVVMRLMRRYDMEDDIVLLAQLDSIISAFPPAPEFRHDFPALKLLGTASEGDDVPPLIQDADDGAINEYEEDLIDSLEWFLLLEGDAKLLIYEAGPVVYKHLLKTRSYAAIKKLAATINSSRIAQVVELPRQINGYADAESNGDEMQTEDVPRENAVLRKESNRDTQLADVKIFQDLESLAIALETIDNWQQVVESGLRARTRAYQGNKSELKVWKKEMQQAHSIVMESIQPLLQGWLLPTKGKTGEEMDVLERIRIRMLPELVLAYISILSFGGVWVNRENLLECMNLAKEIADEDKDLCQTFIDAKRMAELMTTMANVSKQIVFAQESTGGLKMMRRRGGGELLDIWSVNADREG